MLRELLPRNGNNDYRVTIILNSEPFEVRAISEVLPLPPSRVQAEIQYLERDVPHVKATRWVALRQPAEQSKQRESNEVLLANREGQITEGLSSNFAVVTEDGDVMMAPRRMVLAGTIMELVREAAGEFGTVVREECPSVRYLGDYSAAFITSTSRALLPIETIIVPDGSTITWNSDSHPLVRKLKDRITRMLIERSTPLS